MIKSLDWQLIDKPMHAGMQVWLRDLNRTLVGSPAPLCGAETEPAEAHGHAQSFALTLPPRSAFFLEPA